MFTKLSADSYSKLENLPDGSVTFWPVGNGDSTTICIDKERFIQIDLNHTEKSEEAKDPAYPVIDELIKFLPEKDGKPYLSVFILTHPDEDHCKGFAELLEKVYIGEIWFTPKVFIEYKSDICDDAKAFKDEVNRRVKVINGKKYSDVEQGNRIIIVGYDGILKEDEYKQVAEDFLVIPGNKISRIDGEDLSDKIEFFIHSPFKDDIDGEKNETSLGAQVTLKNESNEGKMLFFGDLNNEILKKVCTRTKDKKNLQWNVLLAPHHCSKTVLYEKTESGEKICEEIYNALNNNQISKSYVISSSVPVPSRNNDGDDPPHVKAKSRYEEIAEEFICTMEHPKEDSPVPIIFKISANSESKARKGTPDNYKEGIAKARGDSAPPSKPTGYGKR